MDLQPTAKAFIEEPWSFEKDVYVFWLSEMTIDTAVRVRFADNKESIGETQMDLLRDDTEDQYRMFNILERYLADPTLFVESSPVPVPFTVRMEMIQLYYDIDATVARHILGKKLDSRNKDCEEIAATTNLAVGYCRRHYDNFRMVYKQATTSQPRVPPPERGGRPLSARGGGPLTSDTQVVIQRCFMVGKELAEKYAVVVFLCRHRFETLKRKLMLLEFADFLLVGLIMMNHWTSDHITLKPEVWEQMRQLKTHVFKEDSFNELTKMLTSERSLGRLMERFPPILKAVLKIGARLGSAKDLKDLFVDIVEKVAEPYQKFEGRPGELGELLMTVPVNFPKLPISRQLVDMHQSVVSSLFGVVSHVVKAYSEHMSG